MRTSRLSRLEEYHSLSFRNANGGPLNKHEIKRYCQLYAEFGLKGQKTGLNAPKIIDNQYAKTRKIEG